MLLSVAYLVNMIQETIPPEYEMDDQELAEFERDYARWCLEVELDRIQILDNKASRTKLVNQNS
jgi:hypothetical protein